MNYISKSKYLLIIVVIATFLRLFQINNVPPALNWDEVSHGYNAYSILKTGSDEWGKTLPIIFRAYGDYKLPVYIYLTAISESVFGLSGFSVRLPSVIAGVALVVISYFLSKELFKDKKIALIASLLVAIEPWGLFLSRIAVEANVSAMLIALGVILFLKAVNLYKPRYLALSLLCFGLSVWTYNSARIFTPLLLSSLILIYRKKIDYKKSILPAVLFVIFFIPMFYQLFTSTGQARYSNVQILDEGAINNILSVRNNLNYPDPLPRIISNRYTYFALMFVTNYISHFSPEFLFISGGSHYQFNVQGHGLLYLVNLPFFLVGVYVLLRKYKNKNYRLVLIWVVLAPVASSLTREAPHALRSIVFLPAIMIATAIGFEFVYDRLKKADYKKVLIFVYLVVVGFFAIEYLNKYFTDYRRDYSWAWQYGEKELTSYVKDNYQKYDHIIITKKYGEPHEFMLFYWHWNPDDYGNDLNLVRFNQSNWFWVDRFDKFYFVNDWQIDDNMNNFVTESGLEVGCDNKKCLLVTAGNKDYYDWNFLEEIRFLDGSVAFELYENK